MTPWRYVCLVVTSLIVSILIIFSLYSSDISAFGSHHPELQKGELDAGGQPAGCQDFSAMENKSRRIFLCFVSLFQGVEAVLADLSSLPVVPLLQLSLEREQTYSGRN